MEKTPKSMRLHIGLFGRTNVGKSSLLNLIAGQDAAIISAIPGTTTDVVEKTMELLPLGPVVFLDTAGIDDATELGVERKKKTMAALGRSEAAVLVTEAGTWGNYEETVLRETAVRNVPVLIFVNKTDAVEPAHAFLDSLRKRCAAVVTGSCTVPGQRERILNEIKTGLAVLKPAAGTEPPLVGDLIPAGGVVVLVVPIDLQAPKGRLILPQVRTIRDALDNDAIVVTVKEREYAAALGKLTEKPALVVCDSQAVLKTMADTPADVPCTTFSILFARLKGDLKAAAEAAAVIDTLRDGDRVLIAEACTHHALADDIGRVKIPRWMRQFTGRNLAFTAAAGRDYPEDIYEYKLVVHCGACMLNRQEMTGRIRQAGAHQVPVTNYGITIACVQGVLERALAPFPAAAVAYAKARQRAREAV